MKPHRATLILVFGILSIIFCPIFGVFAWKMGSGDLNEIAAGTMDPAGKDITKIGRILGIIGSVLLILWVLGGILIVLMGGLAAVAGSAAS